MFHLYLIVYGAAHALVDATCAGMLFTIPILHTDIDNDLYCLILTYNVAAFGLQPMIGRLADRWRTPREFAVIGCILTATSALTFQFSPIIAVCFAGIGNAFFHIGGGTISLLLTPNRASAPGFFTAPGSIGLAAGIFLGKEGYFVPWVFIVLLAICCMLMFLLKHLRIEYSCLPENPNPQFFGTILLLLFASISIRSLIGLSVELPWKADLTLLAILTFAVAGGKAIGGVLADRFGWIVVSTAALTLSAPLVAFAGNTPWFGILGMFLFNMTMAVTLAAIARMLPGQPGVAFGIPCLALVIGAFPAFAGFRLVPSDCRLILGIILVSAAALFVGLKLLLSSTGDSKFGVKFGMRDLLRTTHAETKARALDRKTFL